MSLELYTLEMKNKSNEKLVKYYSDKPSIFWLRKGEKIIYRDFKKEILPQSSVMVLPSNKSHFFKLTSSFGAHESLIIKFNYQPGFDLISNSEKSNSGNQDFIYVDDSILSTLEFLIRVKRTNGSVKTQKNAINAFYSELSDCGLLHQLFPHKSEKYSERLHRFFESDPQGKHYIVDTCNSLGISRATLIRKLKLENAKYRDVLSSFRINKAIDMMKSGDFSLLDIAFSSGFQSYDTFKKHFSNKMDVTPMDYYKYIKNGESYHRGEKL
ncbi:AraC family transcriptional regulator [Vibrio vulnificus]|uniref:AraC family transcriptional regulator n=1 Tax=Vibrio vulnificus TaxID=672 RepID=UPI0015942111|nr:AraC family transcriptional regulator [Vibrio vulnificus]EJE8557196.1 helix-turn-helix transcriptional regulator [Vibrio vulnificus]NVD20672.1 helix-turn-helix transcriptional regulator [Vibrio vulnificus]